MADHNEDVKYTVFIKVPFPRGDFVDPPTANWNAAKEAALWKTLNSTPKGAQIDWDELAETFSATPAFLLQQAAWLYERQLSHVREHLQVKHTKSTSNATGSESGTSATPPPGAMSRTAAATTGGYAMRRGGSSGGASSRAPSSLSIRAKSSKDFRSDASGPSTPIQGRVPYSRTASTNTVTQAHRSPPAAQRIVSATGASTKAQRRSDEPISEERQHQYSPIPHVRSNLSSSSSSSPSPEPVASRIYSRRARFPASKLKPKGKAPLDAVADSDSDPEAKPNNASEEDEDDSPAFLPFSSAKTTSVTQDDQDLGATLRRYSRRGDRPKLTQRQPKSQGHSGSSSGTLSSPPHNHPSGSSSVPSISSPTGALRSPASSNTNVNPLAAISPRHRRIAQEAGSEGTPSMGSSFSDLDDASVTHSAMEEALANQMRAGGKGMMGMGSLGVVGRMGGLWRQGSSGGNGNGGRISAGPSRTASGEGVRRGQEEKRKSEK